MSPFCLWKVFHFEQLFRAPFYLLDRMLPNSWITKIKPIRSSKFTQLSTTRKHMHVPLAHYRTLTEERWRALPYLRLTCDWVRHCSRCLPAFTFKRRERETQRGKEAHAKQGSGGPGPLALGPLLFHLLWDPGSCPLCSTDSSQKGFSFFSSTH